MKLTIEDIRGVWKAELNGRAEFGDTIEDILWALCPDAPVEHLWHAAEVLGSILGAQVVKMSQQAGFSDEILNAFEHYSQQQQEQPEILVESLLARQDEPEHWEPQADDDDA